MKKIHFSTTLLLFLAIFLFYFQPPLDTDLGWHLRYGKEIWENRHIFKTNEIGFFLKNYQWAHSYSLYQLIIYLLYKYFGFWGISFLGANAMLIFFYLLFLSLKKRVQPFFYTTIGIILINYPVTYLGLRSQIFSLLGIAFIYHWIRKGFPKKSFFWLPIIFAFWANLHGGFILGLFLLALFLINKIILKRKNKEIILTSLIFITSFLATLINPFGFKIYQEVFRHSWYPLNKLIAEWTPPNNKSVVLLLLGIAVVFVSLVTQRKIVPRFKKEKEFFTLFASWSIFTFLSFRAKRNLPFFGLSTVNLLTTNKLLFKNNYQKNLTIDLLISLSTLIIIFLQIVNFKNFNSWEKICALSKWTLPCDAVEFLKTNPKACPKIFAAYEWGGYLAWHLPESKTFVDGRMPAWPTESGKSPYTLYLEIIQGWPDSLIKLESYQPDCLLLSPGFGLIDEIEKNPQFGWEKKYKDKTAIIYKKSNPEKIP